MKLKGEGMEKLYAKMVDNNHRIIFAHVSLERKLNIIIFLMSILSVLLLYSSFIK